MLFYHLRTFLYAKRTRCLTIIEGSLYTGGSAKQLGAVVKFLAQRKISSNTVILTVSFELLKLQQYSLGEPQKNYLREKDVGRFCLLKSCLGKLKIVPSSAEVNAQGFSFADLSKYIEDRFHWLQLSKQ